MNYPIHFFIALVLFFILSSFLNPIDSAILSISSFLIIDLDHFFLFLIEKKSFNPIYFLKYSKKRYSTWIKLPKSSKNKFRYPIFLFHNLEILFVLSLFSFLIPKLIWVLFGFLIHLLFDWFDLYLRKEPIYPKFSLLVLLKKNKNKQKFILP